jgi:hypothetical protein
VADVVDGVEVGGRVGVGGPGEFGVDAVEGVVAEAFGDGLAAAQVLACCSRLAEK